MNLKPQWERDFYKECTHGTSGDSGIGGNTPTDPDCYINVQPEDVVAFIREKFLPVEDVKLALEQLFGDGHTFNQGAIFENGFDAGVQAAIDLIKDLKS